MEETFFGKTLEEAKKRPHFGPRQVRTLKKIKKGLIFIEKPYGSLLKILSEPLLEGVFLRVLASESDDHGKTWSKPAEISLADRGVVPYDGGLWHQINWLARR